MSVLRRFIDERGIDRVTFAVGYRNSAARAPRAESAPDNNIKSESRAARARRKQDVTKRTEARQRVPSHLAMGGRRSCRRRRAAVRTDHAQLCGWYQRQAPDRDLAGRLGR